MKNRKFKHLLKIWIHKEENWKIKKKILKLILKKQKKKFKISKVKKCQN